MLEGGKFEPAHAVLVDGVLLSRSLLYLPYNALVSSEPSLFMNYLLLWYMRSCTRYKQFLIPFLY